MHESRRVAGGDIEGLAKKVARDIHPKVKDLVRLAVNPWSRARGRQDQPGKAPDRRGGTGREVS